MDWNNTRELSFSLRRSEKANRLTKRMRDPMRNDVMIRECSAAPAGKALVRSYTNRGMDQYRYNRGEDI